MADDLGWNDVSFHGSNQIPTPNIDSIAMYGVTMNRHYVPPMCTPSRSSLLTGKYPPNIGMGHFVIASDEPWGLPLDEKVLPQYMKEGGYSTNLVGKWHLGFFQKSYIPTERHFDHFYGYLGPYIDYWDHSLVMLNKPTYGRGYDMRENDRVTNTTNGTYATDVFTAKAVELIKKHNQNKPLFLMINHLAPHTANEDDPMQAPADEIAKFSYIKDPKIQKLAAMMSILDRGVGKVVTALKDTGMLEDTIILFYADNGAPSIGQHSNGGSNGPLRGQKDSPWEGASRGVAAIWSTALSQRQRVSNEYYHVSDWLPTFAGLAGVRVSKFKNRIDGNDIWASLAYNLPTPRYDILHTLDDLYGVQSYTRGNFKYVNGTRLDGLYDGWLSRNISKNEAPINYNFADAVQKSEAGIAFSRYALKPPRIYDSPQFTNTNQQIDKNGSLLTQNYINYLRNKATIACDKPDPTKIKPCNPLVSACLFNIINDPCEFNNIADSSKIRVDFMANIVQQYRDQSVPARNRPGDPLANPSLHNNTWTWWEESI